MVGAVDLGQLGCRDSIRQLGEEPAGADRSQLRRVAREHELAVALRGDLGQPGQSLGVGHAGLIDDHDALWSQIGGGRARRRCRVHRR